MMKLCSVFDIFVSVWLEWKGNLKFSAGVGCSRGGSPAQKPARVRRREAHVLEGRDTRLGGPSRCPTPDAGE